MRALFGLVIGSGPGVYPDCGIGPIPGVSWRVDGWVPSGLSWVSSPGASAYSAAKSAAWSLTNALRVGLAPQRTQVSALHVGYLDTDMAAHVDGPKSDPAIIAALALDGVESGEVEILGDALSAAVEAGLAGPVRGLYPELVN